MKNHPGRWAGPIAIILVLCLQTGRPQSPTPPLHSVLPHPADLGPNWAWPWDNPNNPASISPEQWKREFWEPQDKRPLLTKTWIDLERSTTEEFWGEIHKLIRTLQVLGVTNAPLSRAAILKEVRAQAIGITDFAYATFDQLPDRGSLSDPVSSGGLIVKLAAYTEEFIRERIGTTELGETALDQSLAATQAALRTRQAAEGSAGRSPKVQGATLEGADGGYMVWITSRDGKAESIVLRGRFRVRNVIIDFNRSAVFKDQKSVPEDILRILNLLATGVDQWLNGPTPTGTRLALAAPRLPRNTLDGGIDSLGEFTQPGPPPQPLSLAQASDPGPEPGPRETQPSPRTEGLEAAGPTRRESANPAPGTPAPLSPPPSPPDPVPLAKRLTEADALYARNQLPEALARYKELLVESPDNVDLQIAAGRTLNYLDEQEEAIAAYNKVYELAPETPNVRTWLAELHLAKGEREQAVQWLTDEIKARPNSAWALSWLASTDLEGGDPVTAKAGFREAMGMDPRVASYRRQNGTVLQARKLHRRALTEFAAATYLDPSDAEAYLGVAACYSALGERTAAIKWYGRYLQLDPSGKWAAAARRDLERLREEERGNQKHSLPKPGAGHHQEQQDP